MAQAFTVSRYTIPPARVPASTLPSMTTVQSVPVRTRITTLLLESGSVALSASSIATLLKLRIEPVQRAIIEMRTQGLVAGNENAVQLTRRGEEFAARNNDGHAHPRNR
jgi:Mn-dependent DtxR family transcriptional regulator